MLTLEVVHGSWFSGKLYPMRCDISFDGKWLVYLAMGAKGNTWNGISELPRLTCAAEGTNLGAWFGGGFWANRQTIHLNGWVISKGATPFKTLSVPSKDHGEDLGILYRRMERDGWVRAGPNWGEDQKVKESQSYQEVRIGDDGWEYKPTSSHPTLRANYIGYAGGYKFRFRIEEFPDLLDEQVDWATYDSRGKLIWSRLGVVRISKVSTRSSFDPCTEFDFNLLVAPKNGSSICK